MGMALTRDPYVELRQIRLQDGYYGTWSYLIVFGGKKTGGTFEATDPHKAAKKLARILRRPRRQVWTQLNEAECERFGYIRITVAPTAPPR